MSTELYGVIGLAPLKWNTCRPFPPRARSFPDGDIFIMDGVTSGEGMFSEVLLLTN